ncbi:LytTR family DNA-binding domain-containing protein [Niabella terrae]
MNTVIIEDEGYTAEYLKELLEEIAPDFQVIGQLASIGAATEYFNSHPQPDLIFCDVHLSDGSSFEIFQRVKISSPVIFITAYDQYALQAFKANGIDYILKPFNEKSLLDGINKFRRLYGTAIRRVNHYDQLLGNMNIENASGGTNAFLVKYGDKIKPIKISSIAYFITQHKAAQLITLQNEKYLINKSMDEIEKSCGTGFYRVNRQVLVNKQSIDEVLQSHNRKLLITLKLSDAPVFEINKVKMTDFLSWLSR